MNTRDIERMIALKPSYNSEDKENFKAASRKFLKAVADELGLKKGTYDLRFNAGGIAVSGDAILHSDDVYIVLNIDGPCDWVLGRTCSGRKDYLGGGNNAYPIADLPKGVPAFAEWVRKIMRAGGVKAQSTTT